MMEATIVYKYHDAYGNEKTMMKMYVEVTDVQKKGDRLMVTYTNAIGSEDTKEVEEIRVAR